MTPKKTKRIKKIILTVLLSMPPGFAATSNQLQSDSTAWREARKVLEHIAQQRLSAHGFALKFESRAIGSDGEPLPAVRGSLLVADSGRFRLEYPGGTVVCDGKTLWQYIPSHKQVIVKDASESGGMGGVLLRFLEAKVIKSERQTDGLLRIFMDPGGTGQNLDSLLITVNPDNSAIRSVETQDPAGNRVIYIVKSLRYGVSMKRGEFMFQAPSGMETVDMR
jgi:outer membrane lipoprotein carrier protein